MAMRGQRPFRPRNGRDCWQPSHRSDVWGAFGGVTTVSPRHRPAHPQAGIARPVSRAGRIGVTHHHDATAPVPGGPRRALLAVERCVRLSARARSACPPGRVKTALRPCPAIGQRRSVAVDHPVGPPGWGAPVSGHGEGRSRTPGPALRLAPGFWPPGTPQAGRSPGHCGGTALPGLRP